MKKLRSTFQTKWRQCWAGTAWLEKYFLCLTPCCGQCWLCPASRLPVMEICAQSCVASEITFLEHIGQVRKMFPLYFPFISSAVMPRAGDYIKVTVTR